jgi:hypothetical protein
MGVVNCPECKSSGVSAPLSKCVECGHTYCGRCNPGRVRWDDETRTHVGVPGGERSVTGSPFIGNPDHRVCPNCGSDRTNQGFF